MSYFPLSSSLGVPSASDRVYKASELEVYAIFDSDEEIKKRNTVQLHVADKIIAIILLDVIV